MQLVYEEVSFAATLGSQWNGKTPEAGRSFVRQSWSESEIGELPISGPVSIPVRLLISAPWSLVP